MLLRTILLHYNVGFQSSSFVADDLLYFYFGGPAGQIFHSNAKSKSWLTRITSINTCKMFL